MLRLATYDQIDQIMNIIDDSKERMRLDNLIQWQDGYPNRDTIENDVSLQQLYVYMDSNCIAGICVINQDIYNQYPQQLLEESNPYTVHRLAVSNNFLQQGTGKKILALCIEKCKNINASSCIIDTNSKNEKMIRLIESSGFKYVDDFSLVPNQSMWKAYIYKFKKLEV